MVLMVMNPPANAGDVGSAPASGWCPGGGHGNPLLYSCLENPMDSGAWRAAVRGMTQGQNCRKVCTHARKHTHRGSQLWLWIYRRASYFSAAKLRRVHLSPKAQLEKLTGWCTFESIMLPGEPIYILHLHVFRDATNGSWDIKMIYIKL